MHVLTISSITKKKTTVQKCSCKNFKYYKINYKTQYFRKHIILSFNKSAIN